MGENQEMQWWPSNEAELQTGLQDGLLVESHHLDLKREPSKGRTANRDLAVDLASLAVDGGVLIYGVDEGGTSLSPFELKGFRERVDQVARSLIEEPLPILIKEFPCEANPRHGYAVVIIPESPAAPHMVDGRYRGRGDTTNIVLSDAEVLRLHDRRQVIDSNIATLLQQEIERDPTSDSQREQAHMFVVAEPVSRRSAMLLQAMDDDNAARWISQNLVNGPASVTLSDSWSPDLGSVSTVSRSADGWSAHTGYVIPGRQASPEAGEDNIFEVEVRENGGVRLFCSRASARSPGGQVAKAVLESVISGLTLRTVLIAATISELCKHFGSWDLALGVTNLKGGRSWKVIQSHESWAPYSSEEYVEVTRAAASELASDPAVIRDRLFARLNRALNGGVFIPPQPPERNS